MLEVHFCESSSSIEGIRVHGHVTIASCRGLRGRAPKRCYGAVYTLILVFRVDRWEKHVVPC